jgi:hypothetical protein
MRLRLSWSVGVIIGLLATGGWANDSAASKKSPRVIYPKKTELDFEGASIEGELRNPGELYFMRRPEEKFDSLVKPRKNFHPEVLRDVLQTR